MVDFGLGARPVTAERSVDCRWYVPRMRARTPPRTPRRRCSAAPRPVAEHTDAAGFSCQRLRTDLLHQAAVELLADRENLLDEGKTMAHPPGILLSNFYGQSDRQLEGDRGQQRTTSPPAATLPAGSASRAHPASGCSTPPKSFRRQELPRHHGDRHRPTRAEVSIDTVYATVSDANPHSRGSVETAISGTDQAVPAPQRDYVNRIGAAGTAEEKLAIYAQAITAIQQRLAPSCST